MASLDEHQAREQRKARRKAQRRREREGRKEAQRLQAARCKVAIRELRQLRRTGDPESTLAFVDRMPLQWRAEPKILFEQGLAFQKLGLSKAAFEAFTRTLALDRSLVKAWTKVGSMLRKQERSDEVPAFVEEMISSFPRTSDTYLRAARVASKAGLADLSTSLIDQALSLPMHPSAAALLGAARMLLAQGEHGRVVTLLEKEQSHLDASLQGPARELRDLAVAEIRRARGSDAVPVGETDRPYEIAIDSILGRSNHLQTSFKPVARSIAIICGSLGPGGAQTQTVRLVRELCTAPGRSGPIVIVLASKPNTDSDFYKENLAGLNITIDWIDDFAVDVNNITTGELAGQLGVLPPRVISKTAFLIDRFRAHRPEVVLTMSSYAPDAVLAACIAGVPRIVVSARGGLIQFGRLPTRFLKRPYRSAVVRNRIFVTTNSAATAREFADWLEVPASRVATIYNGVAVDELISRRNPTMTAAYRSMLNIAPAARVVGSVFNSRSVKRPELWAQAAAIIGARASDVVFVIVGGNSAGDELSDALVRHGLEHRFHRVGVRRDVPTWLDLMDVVLLTSSSEGTPNVLLEAQALGRPVVATAVGGNAETFLPGTTGILVSANPTPEEIADAVLQVLDDPDFTARAREQGPAFIRQRFGVERMVSEFVDLCFGQAATV